MKSTVLCSAYSDESIRFYNLTLELAPWVRYIAALEHWLSRLDRETGSAKPIIRFEIYMLDGFCVIFRVLVAIIDAFHFDVADSNDVVNEDGTNSIAVTIRNKIDREVLPRLRKCINGKVS